jgi:glycogen debranching enzyme
MRFLWRVGRYPYQVRWEGDVLRVARRERPDTAPPGLPDWLAVAVTGAQGFAVDGRYLDVIYPKGVARKAMAQASPFLPGAIWGVIPPRIPGGTVEMVVAADSTAQAAAARARRLRDEAFDLAQARRARLEKLLEENLIRTGDERDDRALAWARISLDNLIMEQRGLGIYAGFYWFTTYWGRDTFITLPGACLVQGDFATAEAILRSFAAWQDRDPQSPREGRLPNFVTVEQVQFAGVDGTWWFVRALDELWRRSGDDAFAREMAPVVIRAAEGALCHAVNAEGFLTHGDGETWMDAGGEQHSYSPRGDRAVEVQALFHGGLLVAARLAASFGRIEGAPAGLSGEALAARYNEQAGKLAGAFTSRFWRDGRLVDHLNRDGTPDTQIRPNGLLAILASPTLFSRVQRATVVREAEAQLVRPQGVLSLAEQDPHFHPHHLDLEHYYYDEAYHNGDVWLWLSGAYVSALADPRRGFCQTRMLLDEILDEGAVGTLQEIRDGAPAAGNDEFGGATSQAWSLAELLRTVVDDYLGLEVDLTADPPRIVVTPACPPEWSDLVVRTRIGEQPCIVECRRRGPADVHAAAGGGSPTGSAPDLEILMHLRNPLPEDWNVSATWLDGQTMLAPPLRPVTGAESDWPYLLRWESAGPAAGGR